MKLRSRDKDIGEEEAAEYRALPFVYDWITKIAEEKIFKSAYKELKEYALGQPARKEPEDSEE